MALQAEIRPVPGSGTGRLADPVWVEYRGDVVPVQKDTERYHGGTHEPPEHAVDCPGPLPMCRSLVVALPHWRF